MNDAPAVALSIRQPWAHLIVNGIKPVENRSWATSFRGPVWIHAGKAWGSAEKQDRWNVMTDFQIDIPETLPLGGIVGYAEIYGCVRHSLSPWFTGPHGFLIKNACPVPFRACPGKLGFFQPADAARIAPGKPQLERSL